MSKTINVVVAYDGSECADIALEDLRYAGIPDGSTITVISVSEWFPSVPVEGTELMATRPVEVEAESISLAKKAAERIKEQHPTWDVQSEGIVGSPAREIIRRSDELGADLVVVGSHGRSAVGRFLLGSVSHQILTAMGGQNVRIARKGYSEQSTSANAPRNIFLTIDGSNYSEAVINTVLSRSWSAGTSFVVMSAAEYSYDHNEEKEGLERLRGLHSLVTERLGERGFTVRSVIDTKMAHPKRAILAEAKQANAGCIFLGARGLTGFERFVLGSVSTSVAMQAECSVEIVQQDSDS